MRDPACEQIECSLGVFYQQRVWMVLGGNGHRLGVVLDGRACCGYVGTTEILSMTKSYICCVPVQLRPKKSVLPLVTHTHTSPACDR
jgi:hypothetical protein